MVLNFSEMEFTSDSIENTETQEICETDIKTLTVSPEGLHYLGQIDGINNGKPNTLSLDETESMLQEFDCRLHQVLKWNNDIKLSLNSIDCISNKFFSGNNFESTSENPLIREFPQYFIAPDDLEQVEGIKNTIIETENLQPENWEQLSLTQRQECLSQLEKTVAKIEHRPASEVIVEPLDDRLAGYFDPTSKTIHLNEAYVKSNDSKAYFESLDTLLHEGRHAYQHYNLTEREVHPNHAAIEEWQRNYNWGYESGRSGLFDFHNTGLKLYTYQPVEYDARIFAGNVINSLKNEWRTSV